MNPTIIQRIAGIFGREDYPTPKKGWDMGQAIFVILLLLQENGLIERSLDNIIKFQDMELGVANFGRTGENKADVKGDGVVNIVDLVKVAGVLGNAADNL